jgi:hypothetical protein
LNKLPLFSQEAEDQDKGSRPPLLNITDNKEASAG